MLFVQASLMILIDRGLLLDWKGTVLSFFLHGSFVVEYTESTN